MDELIAKLDRLIHTTNELHSHYDEINTLISEMSLIQQVSTVLCLYLPHQC